MCLPNDPSVAQFINFTIVDYRATGKPIKCDTNFALTENGEVYVWGHYRPSDWFLFARRLGKDTHVKYFLMWYVSFLIINCGDPLCIPHIKIKKAQRTQLIPHLDKMIKLHQ